MSALPLLHRPLTTCLLVAVACISHSTTAATISRLTPPSERFASGNDAPVIARFLPGQLFDLQATVQPDPGQAIVNFAFSVDGMSVTDRFRPEAESGGITFAWSGDCALA